jgi:hypothetical protein
VILRIFFNVEMSLVSGPGRGGGAGGAGGALSANELSVQKHVEYIQSLDTVRILT